MYMFLISIFWNFISVFVVFQERLYFFLLRQVQNRAAKVVAFQNTYNHNGISKHLERQT